MSSDRPLGNHPPDWDSRLVAMAQKSLAQHDASDTSDEASAETDQWQSFSQVVSEIWESIIPGHSLSSDGPRETIDESIAALYGKRLGPYEIREAVGYGGFGIVFRALDRRLQRDVALKIPRPEWVVRADSWQRFIEEARLAAVLRHPGIVQVYEARQVGPVVYIASEFCEGPSLHDWLCEHPPLTARQAATMLADVADAVGFAHSLGIVHQDLKPANILLDQLSGVSSESFAPRVTDFGLSFRVDPQSGQGSPLIGGTPKYMAPEQVNKQAANVGPHTDVYALGIMLKQLLERADSQASTSTDSRDLAAIGQKCTHASPPHRYRDGWELRDDLRRFLLGDPVRARPISTREGVARWIRRRPALAGLSALLLFVVITALIGLLGLLARERHLRQLADRRQQEAEEVVDTMLTRYVHQSMLKDVKLTDEQGALLEHAVRFYENLAAELPSDDRRRHKTSVALHRLSEIHAWRGFMERAIEIRQRGIDILSDLVAKYPDNNEYRYDDFYNNHCVAEIYGIQRTDKALPYRERAGQQIEYLASLEPDNMIYQDALVTHKMAMLDSSLWSRAASDQQRSLADSLEKRIRRFVQGDPQNVNWHRKLRVILSLQSFISVRSGQKAAALVYATKAVVAARQVVAIEPEIWAYQDELATAINTRANLERENGDESAAEDSYLEILSILEPIAAEAELNTNRQWVIGHSHMFLAKFAAQSGRTDEARERFRTCGRIFWELRDRDPDDSKYATAFAKFRTICPYDDLVREFESTKPAQHLAIPASANELRPTKPSQ